MNAAVEPWLLEAWLRGRSRARGLPDPVACPGGWRVETRSLVETRRYVFPGPHPQIARLAEAISAPRILLKACAAPEEVAPLLPARWSLQPQRFFMTAEPDAARPATLPAGYRIWTWTDASGGAVAILDATGVVAASGRCAESGGVLVYDQIVTQLEHRRRGLGRVIMRTLAGLRSPAGRIDALVATSDGRGLYRSLGWRQRSLYTTAAISTDAAGDA